MSSTHSYIHTSSVVQAHLHMSSFIHWKFIGQRWSCLHDSLLVALLEILQILHSMYIATRIPWGPKSPQISKYVWQGSPVCFAFKIFLSRNGYGYVYFRRMLAHSLQQCIFKVLMYKVVVIELLVACQEQRWPEAAYWRNMVMKRAAVHVQETKQDADNQWVKWHLHRGVRLSGTSHKKLWRQLRMYTHTSTYTPGWQSFLSTAELCTFCRIGLHSSKSCFFYFAFAFWVSLLLTLTVCSLFAFCFLNFHRCYTTKDSFLKLHTQVACFLICRLSASEVKIMACHFTPLLSDSEGHRENIQ